MKNKTGLIFSIIFLLLILSSPALIYSSENCPSDDPCKEKTEANEKVDCYDNVVRICSSQRESMAAQIVYLNTKIELTLAKIENNINKIESVEGEILKISDKIEGLENSLTRISGMFINRIVAAYKFGEFSYIDLLLSSKKFEDFITRYKYIQTVQAHDRKLLFQLQNSKINFEEQKILREEKKKELADLRSQLETEEQNLEYQKRDKQVFLDVTRNNETVYKQNLAAAQKEAREIQKAASILSSAGVAKNVSKGEVIGVMGNTGFSTGSHLHFAVYNLNESDLDKFNFESGHDNPVNYLSNRELPFEANSCNDVGSAQNKSIGGGSWSWPMSSPKISQCYGNTPYSAAYYRSGLHSGLDMHDDGNPLIKATEAGNAYTYRGGQSAGNTSFYFSLRR